MGMLKMKNISEMGMFLMALSAGQTNQTKQSSHVDGSIEMVRTLKRGGGKEQSIHDMSCSIECLETVELKS